MDTKFLGNNKKTTLHIKKLLSYNSLKQDQWDLKTGDMAAIQNGRGQNLTQTIERCSSHIFILKDDFRHFNVYYKTNIA